MHNKVTPKLMPQALDPRVRPSIANPTMQQVNKTDSKSVTKATFEDVASNPEKAEVAGILKPKASRFEPAPVLYKLPSNGKSVPEHLQNMLTENKEIYIRRISSSEELIIGKIRTEPHKLLSIITECLEKCIKTNLPMKYFMTLDKIPMFLFLLDISYTDKDNEQIEVECPECKEKQKRKLSIKDDINIRYIPDDFKYPLSITTNKSYDRQYLIEFDAPTFEHESLLENEQIEASQLLHNLVINITDLTTHTTVPKDQWLDLINYLDFEDRVAFRDEIENVSNNYGTDVKIDFICENKGCTTRNQTQKIDLPLDQIFINLAKNKTI